MNDLFSLTPAQLNHAADLKEKIAALETELASILNFESAVAVKTPKKSKMSAAGRARIAAAQRARWAKAKSPKPAKDSGTIKRRMSAAARANMAAVAKARWAKVKAAGKTSL